MRIIRTRWRGAGKGHGPEHTTGRRRRGNRRRKRSPNPSKIKDAGNYKPKPDASSASHKGAPQKPSEKQINLLRRFGYTDEQIGRLDRKQAGALIHNIEKNGWQRVEWREPQIALDHDY